MSLEKLWKGKHWIMQLVAFALVIVGFFILLFIGAWLISPYNEGADNVICGLNQLFSNDCNFRYKG